MYYLLALCILALLSYWFYRSAESGFGPAHRLVQYFYTRIASLNHYQKSGKTYASAAAIVEQEESPFVQKLMRKVAPDQAGWFSRHFPTDKADYHDYLPLYDALFEPYQKCGGIWLLEIGVKKGGSLVLWRELFDEHSFVYGIDVTPEVPTFVRDGHIKVLTFDSTDVRMAEAALRGLSFDIIIDDGDHSPISQLRTFEALRPFLSPRGVYILEDVYSFDPGPYSTAGFDFTSHPDRSGQALVVLYPQASLARNSSLWKDTGEVG